MRNRWRKRHSESLYPPLEKDFQQQVIDLAQIAGWLHYHTYDSRRSPAGYPDLSLVRNGRLIYAELKSESGSPSDEQQKWLDELDRVPGVEVYVWRPSDWDEIERVLARRRIN